jgi:hypothetical protein
MTTRDLLFRVLLGSAQWLALLLVFLVGVTVERRLHAPVWAIVPLLVAVAALGSGLRWVGRKRGAR